MADDKYKEILAQNPKLQEAADQWLETKTRRDVSVSDAIPSTVSTKAGFAFLVKSNNVPLRKYIESKIENGATPEQITDALNKQTSIYQQTIEKSKVLTQTLKDIDAGKHEGLTVVAEPGKPPVGRINYLLKDAEIQIRSNDKVAEILYNSTADTEGQIANKLSNIKKSIEKQDNPQEYRPARWIGAESSDEIKEKLVTLDKEIDRLPRPKQTANDEERQNFSQKIDTLLAQKSKYQKAQNVWEKESEQRRELYKQYHTATNVPESMAEEVTEYRAWNKSKSDFATYKYNVETLKKNTQIAFFAEEKDSMQQAGFHSSKFWIGNADNFYLEGINPEADLEAKKVKAEGKQPEKGDGAFMGRAVDSALLEAAEKFRDGGYTPVGLTGTTTGGAKTNPGQQQIR